jgi:colicin import membrane protein
LFGDKASAPLPTESSLAYRKRLVHRFKQHSPRFANERLDQPLSDASMRAVEDVIYADAAGAAKENSWGKLVPVEERDAAGRLITRFMGDPDVWMNAFKGVGCRTAIIAPTPGKK